MTQDHDLIVVGMGVGGEEVAGRAAQAGLDVVGIEHRLVGGECPYWGCIPSKMMVRAANSLAESRRAERLAGRTTQSPDWDPVVERVRAATANWDDTIAVERFTGKGGTFLRGKAHVVGPREVEVGGHRLRARRGIVLSTGGEPTEPPIDGLSDVDYWTNREAIEASELPRSIVVIGGGPIGLELAQAFRRFGTDVTIIERSEHVLPLEEPENGEAVGKVLGEDGIKVLTKATTEHVSQSAGGITVKLDDGRTIDAERLLVATGRHSDLAGLGVANAGLDPDARAVATDDHMRAADGVWAVGDVTGKGAFTHIAVYQGRIAAADILGEQHAPADYSAVPRVTFTDPEVASVGLSEKQARERGLSVRTGVATTSSSARGWIHGPGAEHGVAKVIADAEKDVLVGGSVMGPSAGEVLGLLVLAIRERIPVPSLRELIYPYPTFVRGLEDALRELG